MYRVVVGLPTMGYVDVKTCESLMKMRSLNYKTFPLSTEYSLIYEARNNIIKKALENESVTHILFVDSDIVFDSNALDMMLEDDADIVTGVYSFKDDSGKIVGCDVSNEPFEPNHSLGFKTFQIGRCGMGFCLIKREVFEKVLKWFDGECFHPFANMGEDYSFCERAKSVGFKIWMNPNVRCKHIGKKVYEV